MVDLGGIVVLNGRRGIVQHRQQVLFHVSRLCGVRFQAVKHEPDMLHIQFQQPGRYHCLGETIPRYPDCFRTL